MIKYFLAKIQHSPRSDAHSSDLALDATPPSQTSALLQEALNGTLPVSGRTEDLNLSPYGANFLSLFGIMQGDKEAIQQQAKAVVTDVVGNAVRRASV